MKIKQKASVAFKELKPAEKVNFATGVIAALTANPKDFPNLPLPVDALQECCDNLDEAVVAANTGNHVSVAALDPFITEWNNDFEQTAAYVSAVANGSEALIKKAGFYSTKGESSSAHLPPVAVDFQATLNGKKGAVIVKSKKAITGSKVNVFFLAPYGVDVNFNDNVMQVSIGDKTVYILANTRKQAELYNLPKGVLFTAGMYGVNTAGSGPAATQEVTPQ